jgi:hypothetical protein
VNIATRTLQKKGEAIDIITISTTIIIVAIAKK